MPIHDVIVIGSGFGGAVTRPAGWPRPAMKVLVARARPALDAQTYPRNPDDPWIWTQDPAAPFSTAGPTCAPSPTCGWPPVTGVGGGSLIYANVSVEAKPEVFDGRWPAGPKYGS